MRAFTVYQPYAYAIVAGLKGYETRPRRTNIRGRVAVHAAGRNPDRVPMEAAMALPDHIVLCCSAVIGTVEIVDCLPVEEVIPTLTPRERALGNYSPGRWAWVLKNPVMFETPIPASGKQGWWNWEDEQMQLVEFNARCPFELGEKIPDGDKMHTITDIVCLHYLKNPHVEFMYEFDNSGKLVNIIPGTGKGGEP